MSEFYWSTQGGSGQLYLNITGTHGLVSYDISVLDGAAFLRPVDFDGAAAHANLVWTDVHASAMQTAKVVAGGPTMGHSSYSWLSEASCTAPDGRDCYDHILQVEEPGTWAFAIDYSAGPTAGMWYVGAVFPR